MPLQVTARLARDLELGDGLMQLLQPHLAADAAVAGGRLLPPMHWLARLGAEELLLARLLAELSDLAAHTATRVMATPTHGDAGAAALAHEVQGGSGAMAAKAAQIGDCVASCSAIAAAVATQGAPDEAPLARAQLAHVQAAAAGCVRACSRCSLSA